MPRPKANRRTKDKKARYTARLYVGQGKYRWIGTFDTPQERDDALEAARGGDPAALTCGQWADRYMAEYERRNKASSAETARASLKRFRDTFGDRPLASVSRIEAKDWVASVPPSSVPVVVSMFNQAVEDEVLGRNPFRGLGQKSRGRADEAPPTEEELGRLLDACSVLGWYAPRMRALIRFAAYMGMRPGEIFELKWSDIDFEAMRVRCSRRVYKGRVDTPKSNKPKTVALTPPAFEAVTSLPRESEYVFTNKSGGRMAQETLGRYWGKVTARAGLDFDFYLATKHFCAHYLWVTLDLSERAIVAQMGWSSARMLETYGHGDIGALEEIDAAFVKNVVRLRGLKDVSETQGGA